MYDFKFTMVGGVPRVRIDSAEDIRHLGELDQKLWTVLSCPVTGLELDEASLRLMDYNNDGKIHVNEVVQTAQWLCSVLQNPRLLLDGTDHIRLSDINRSSDDGAKIYDSARQILTDLGREPKDDSAVISIADTADSMAIFGKTLFNGDGVIIPESTEDPELRQTIIDCINTIGKTMDRSGVEGVNADLLKTFYDEATNYMKWYDSSAPDTFPFAERTADCYSDFLAVCDKVNDWFTRCALAGFDESASEALGVRRESLDALAARSLSVADEDIASLPLAQVSSDMSLSIDSLNPAWRDRFMAFYNNVCVPLFGDTRHLTVTDWQTVVAKFAPYIAWSDAHAGDNVAPLAVDRIRQIVSLNNLDALLHIIDEDAALQTQADSISLVDKLLHLNRDFYTLLCNFVTFSDFYSLNRKAIFQAGTLYIDQRACDLCLCVTDMGARDVNVSFSGMYLIYCHCVSHTLNKNMDIVAALTVGDVQHIRVGKNALFYDREGNDWDATVTRIIDNPISIGQAFWTPYRKLANFIEEQVSKFASSKNDQMMANTTSKITDSTSNLENVSAAAAQNPPTDQNSDKPKPAPFDIAKFCGIFAAIGMALGYIGGFIVSCVTGFVSLRWWQMPIALAGIALLISGPSMLLAWLKLRRRNLSPLLNANGWALNNSVIINILFGATLTHASKLPAVKLSELRKADPFTKKYTPVWKWLLPLIGVHIIAAVIVWIVMIQHRKDNRIFAEYNGAEVVVAVPDISLNDSVTTDFVRYNADSTICYRYTAGIKRMTDVNERPDTITVPGRAGTFVCPFSQSESSDTLTRTYQGYVLLDRVLWRRYEHYSISVTRTASPVGDAQL